MVKIFRNCDPMADCKPVVFMSCFLLIFWLLLSYVTNSYFAIFLMVSNFILIFGCCVSLSGYVVGQLIDTRRETGQLIEVTTISASQPFVRPPEYPPSYDEAVRYGWQHCRAQSGSDGVVLCIPLESEPRINPIYMNVPHGAPVETSNLPITYSGLPNIPSYEMSISSAAVSPTLPLTVIPRATAVSDLESSTNVMEPYPTIVTLTPLPRSTITDTDLERSTSVIPEASISQTLTLPSRSSTVSDIDLEPRITSSAITESHTVPQISRVCVSESTESCSKSNGSVSKIEHLSRSKTRVHHERDWNKYGELPTSSQDLEFQRCKSSIPSRHPILLNRSLSFPSIK